MIITLFRSRLTSQAGDDYSAMAAEMLERARTYPGFIAMKEFNAEDGERLTVVWWDNNELQAAWRRDERHLAAQKLGRERSVPRLSHRSRRGDSRTAIHEVNHAAPDSVCVEPRLSQRAGHESKPSLASLRHRRDSRRGPPTPRSRRRVDTSTDSGEPLTPGAARLRASD